MTSAPGTTRFRRALTGLLLVLLAACGSRSIADADPVTLRVLMTDDWGDTPAFLAAVNGFEKAHPGVRVEVSVESIRNMAGLVQSQVEAGDPVDVVQWHAFAAGSLGIAEELDDLWGGVDEDEFFPGAMADVTWGGHRYGLPLDTNALVLMIRQDVLAAAGLGNTPGFDSFDELSRAATAVTSADGSQRLLAIPTSGWRTFGWILANGGNLLEFAEDGTPIFTLDSPEVVGALEFLSSLIARGQAFAPVGANSTGDSLALFRSGAAAVYASGSWDFSALDDQLGPSMYSVALMPGGETGKTAGSAMGGSSLFVPKGSANRELAFEFMTMLTQNPYALQLAREEGRLPARVEIFDDEFFQEERLRLVRKQLETAQPLLLEAFPEAFQAYNDAVNAILTVNADPATELAAAQRRAVESRVR